jgi:PAS domain S-box-containing protein
MHDVPRDNLYSLCPLWLNKKKTLWQGIPMTQRDNAKTEEMTELRRKAEAQLKKKIVRLREQSSGDPERVLAELHVHQIELEMQNEELRRTQYELEASRHKYTDLYEFAPIGYFTFDTYGHVVEANLTGCQMLGVERGAIINKPFRSFVARESQNQFHLHRRAALTPGLKQTCEIALVRKDGEKFEARLDSVPVQNDDEHVIGSRVAVIDITKQKQAQTALLRAKKLSDAINRINKLVHTTLDSNQIMEKLLTESVAVLGSGTGAISLRREGGWVVGHVIGLPAGVVGSRMSDKQEAHAVLAIESGAPVAVEDAFKDKRFNRTHLRRHNIRALLVVPLIIRGQGLGAIFFNYHVGPRQFAESEVNFARQLAATASVALENARLSDEQKRAEQILRESEQKHRTFFEGSLDAVLLSSPDGSIEAANAAACEMFQMTQDELRQAGRSGIVDKSDPRLARFLEERAKAGSFRGELNFKRKDGTIFPGEISSGVFTGQGGVARTAMIIRDITERKQAEEAMRREAQILAQVHDSVITTDLQGNITLWNKGAERLFGYTADEALGRPVSLIYFDEDLPILSDHIIAPMLEGSENELEVRCRHKSGREVFLHLSLSVLRDEHGSPIELIGYSLDITERKKAEDALRRSEQRMKLAQTSAGAGLWDWDMSTGEIEWSDELFRLFGLDPAKHEASFETWRSVLHPDDRLLAEKRIETAIESHTSHNSEYRIVLESGQVRWINSLGDAIYDDNGKPQHMSGICIDITDRKLAEEEISNLARFPTENPLPVLRLRADGTILYNNTPGLVLLEQWNCQKSQKAPENWCNLVKKSLRNNRNLVEQIKCGDRIYSFTMAPIRDGGYVNLYGRDITVQEQVKEVLRKSRDQLEVRVRERTAELAQTVAMLQGEIELRKCAERLLRLEEARLEALVHLSSIHEGSVPEISGFILEQGIALTGSKIGFVGFLSEDESVYTLDAVSKNVMKECNVIDNPMQWRMDKAGLWAEAIRQRKTLFVNDYGKAHPTKKGLPHGHPAVSRFMVVPLFEGERIVVVAGVGNKASDYDSSDERQMTLLLAGMWNYNQRKRAAEALQERTVELSRVNVALEKEVAERRRAENKLRANEQALRDLAAELQLAEEKERRRIAQDLHDSIGQILAFSGRELKNLRKSLPNETAGIIGEVVEQLDTAIGQTRTLSFDLSPGILYDLGFEAAVEDLIDRMNEAGRIRCRFQSCSYPKPLTDDVKILLYRSIRELLINAAKHAKAGRVEVSLLRSNYEIYVKVEDNGRGFDVDILNNDSKKREGFGLFSIRERLNHIGGSLKIESVRGKGTKVTMAAPLNLKGPHFEFCVEDVPPSNHRQNARDTAQNETLRKKGFE